MTTLVFKDGKVFKQGKCGGITELARKKYADQLEKIGQEIKDTVSKTTEALVKSLQITPPHDTNQPQETP